MPANDNFANAEEIANESGVTTGDNISASAEGSEPANEGRTVWYKWTCPASHGYGRVVQFSTRWYHPDSGENPAAPLRTKLQAFTGASVGALTEVEYHARSEQQNFSKFETGSSIQFVAFPNGLQGSNGIYYVRVDGVGGDQGEFCLHWKEYFNPMPGACDAFGDTNSNGYECVALVQLGDVTAGTSLLQSFGTFDSGTYLVRYIRGAWVQDTPTKEWAGIMSSTAARAGGAPSKFIDILLDDGANSPPTANFKSFINESLPDEPIHASGDEAQWAFASKEQQQRCDYAGPFAFQGGTIKLRWQDPHDFNQNAQTIDSRYMNPWFGLYRVL